MNKYVGSLHTFLHAIEIQLQEHHFGNKDEMLLFRGQPSDCYLLPKIARELNELKIIGGPRRKGFLELEFEMFSSFKRMLTPYIQNIPDSDLDVLAIGQHYGLATRLLDWTENPLVALFFAGSKGTVWILKADKNKIIYPSKDLNPFSSKEINIFRPSLLDKRLIAQKGWFTLHSFNENKNIFIPMEENDLFQKNLLKIDISSSEILSQLDICGVNYSSLFPDLSGLSTYLNSNWYKGMFINIDPSSIIINGKKDRPKAANIRAIVKPLVKKNNNKSKNQKARAKRK